jgi:hypothetical protein
MGLFGNKGKTAVFTTDEIGWIISMAAEIPLEKYKPGECQAAILKCKAAVVSGADKIRIV